MTWWDVTASAPALTEELLEKAWRGAMSPRPRGRTYLVAPNRLRLGVIALAYLHGAITRREYGELFNIERACLIAEGQWP